MNVFEQIEEMVDKPVKCPFGKCDQCEKGMDPETCAIQHSHRLASALMGVVIELGKQSLEEKEDINAEIDISSN